MGGDDGIIGWMAGIFHVHFELLFSDLDQADEGVIRILACCQLGPTGQHHSFTTTISFSFLKRREQYMEFPRVVNVES